MKVTEPGVYEMPHAEYLADPVPGGSLSSSGARLLLPPSCPAIFRYRQDHPPESTAVFDFGHAAHKLVLGAGPELQLVPFDDWRTSAAKAAREKAYARGRTPLLAAQYGQVQEMAAVIREHPIASALFDPGRGGKPEQSLFWEYDGIWKRGRLDWIPGLANHSRGRPVLSDYKTARSADPGSIARSVANFGYHQQAAWYLEGVRVLTGADCAFVFVFQEKEAPYLVTVCELDYAALDAGAALNARAAEVYRDCKEADLWPGYGDDIELISLPPWATRIEEYA